MMTPGCGAPGAEGPAGTGGYAANASDVESEVRGVLDEQVDAWNEGSILRFMDGYARTDSLRFASGGDVWYGWERTLQRYRESFADAAAMGTLSFDELDVDVLSSDRAIVFGRWRLSRTGTASDAGGLFTLLFENRPEGWRIVYDHTSSGMTAARETE